ncbi:uncharacterized protein LOC123306321 [Coccinella septempunctata]|uniref:uncharacterized protein LOC123306321 n=1 Tax=Coccinella septempunctata TaxID=41139 RepID=UPI001D063B08|nr:uncharacterized protein LOC123306321 [Coccinella septempunctata]
MENFETTSSDSSDQEVRSIRRKKVYRKRVDLQKYDDIDFFDRFRLKKETVLHLLQEIEDAIKMPTNRGGCITPIQQLLLTLRFYATGHVNYRSRLYGCFRSICQ